MNIEKNGLISEIQKHISLKQSDSIHITKRSKKSPKKPMDQIVTGITDRRKAMNAISKWDITQCLKLQRILMFITVLLVGQFVHFARYNN
ncbi:hypothetical protein SAMN05421755_105122 [Nitrosomonas sp. Nm33]|nr:hypothetical protein SAMN05421755_105122 [Nitrosomonas sp. Nm33]